MLFLYRKIRSNNHKINLESKNMINTGNPNGILNKYLTNKLKLRSFVKKTISLSAPMVELEHNLGFLKKL